MNKDLYIKQFIELCHMLCTKRSDYEFKKNIKIHNKAAKQLFLMKKEIGRSIDIAIPVYLNLLENEDSNIRIQSAAHCLSLKIHVNKAIEILKVESKKKDIDDLLALDAEMCLTEYNEKIINEKL